MTNQTTSQQPQLHQLNSLSREALGNTINFYEAICADIERVAMEGKEREQQYLNMLGEILRLPGIGPKAPDETLVDTVARYIQTAQSTVEAAISETAKASEEISSLRTAYRDLCQKQNITLPCDLFVGNEPTSTTCGKCDHPAIAHTPLTIAE